MISTRARLLKIYFSFSNVYTNLFALFVQLPFSCLSCASSSWLPLLHFSFPSFSLFPTPKRQCQSERSPKARHEANSFEPTEWSKRLTPGQLGWQGAAAVGSIPAPALSHSESEQKKITSLSPTKSTLPRKVLSRFQKRSDGSHSGQGDVVFKSMSKARSYRSQLATRPVMSCTSGSAPVSVWRCT